jgi:mannose-6-phosphate isomerase-like protein (cupin superfamily)
MPDDAAPPWQRGPRGGSRWRGSPQCVSGEGDDIAALAYWTHSPLVVPSLGPTAFLVFNRSQSIVARPRNGVLGHLIGAVAGYVALLVFGLGHAPDVLHGGLTAPRIGAAALSIALTSAVMILFRVEHGPAGATTLIVSLGFMTSIASLGLLMAGVVMLIAEGVLIDRLVGLDVPYWSDRSSGSAERRYAHGLGPLRAFTAHPPARHDGHRADGHRADGHRADGHRADGADPGSDADAAAGGERRVTRRHAVSRWVVGPGEGRRVQVGSEECTVKVDRPQAGDAYALLEVVFNPRQPVTMLHVHTDFPETYWVLDGEVAAEIGTDRVKAGPGSVITVPAGVPHLLGCATRVPARCLCITAQGTQSHPEFLP